jgi:membrane protein implicated in regulation of membrane protease activity
MMKKIASVLWPAAGILLSACGIAAFVLLFVRDMNVYWFILSPIIFAIYQIPAVVVIWLWKKKRQKSSQENPDGDG